MCVELICCVLSSAYSVKATLEYVLWPEFLQKIKCTIFDEFLLSLVASIFLIFGEVMVEYFVYKTVFGFSLFCFYYFFMKFFLFQSKTKNAVQDIIEISLNWMRKNPDTLLQKKNADFLLFDILTGFFWRFYGKLELGKVKDVHPEVYMRQSIQEWTK